VSGVARPALRIDLAHSLINTWRQVRIYFHELRLGIRTLERRIRNHWSNLARRTFKISILWVIFQHGENSQQLLLSQFTSASFNRFQHLAVFPTSESALTSLSAGVLATHRELRGSFLAPTFSRYSAMPMTDSKRNEREIAIYRIYLDASFAMNVTNVLMLSPRLARPLLNHLS
jgi:hypothetical protein